MVIFGLVVAISALFYLLGQAADVVINNVKKIGEQLGIKIFFLGVLLGFFTSLPELGIGFNALITNVSTVAVGNLLGGIVVLFSLSLGLSVVLNRKIRSREDPVTLGLIFIYFLLPIFLGFDGYIGVIDGLMLIGLYLLLLFYLYHNHRNHQGNVKVIVNQRRLAKNFFLAVVGLTAVILIVNLFIRFTHTLLDFWQVRPFVVGLLIFSVGTNLPEIIVTVKSWRRNIKDLSVSNLIGSGLANVFILGFLGAVKPISIVTGQPFYFLAFFIGLLFLALIYFYKTDKQLSFYEGVALLGIYLLFLTSQLVII